MQTPLHAVEESSSAHLKHSSSRSNQTVFLSVGVALFHQNKPRVNKVYVHVCVTHPCRHRGPGVRLILLRKNSFIKKKEETHTLTSHTWKIISMNIFRSHHLFWPSVQPCTRQNQSALISFHPNQSCLLRWTGHSVCVSLWVSVCVLCAC